MSLPVSTVPNKATWEKARAEAGGKAGLSKAGLTKALEAFHTAYEKAKTGGDLGPLTTAIHTLDQAAKKYIEDIKALKKYDKLVTAVTQKIVTPLHTFVSALDNMAKAANQEITRIENEIKNRIDMVKRTTTECHKKVEGMNQEFQGISNRYKLGVPKAELPDLQRMVNEGSTLFNSYKKAIEELDKELTEVVTKYIGSHKPLIEKHNTELGAAKGEIKKNATEIQYGLTRMKEMHILMEKVI